MRTTFFLLTLATMAALVMAGPMSKASTSGVCNGVGATGECGQCLNSADCISGYYCCPYMRKCVASSSMPCYYPIADCRPMCYDNLDPNSCNCANPDFPNNWCQ
eukprot:GFUD01103047.1.p1 GENE.GFUD01103047.1~~GFUD01103047.1.p1  ORF type:complete len:104 (-),score=13.49 GFUD01103047.1:75-386(-)